MNWQNTRLCSTLLGLLLASFTAISSATQAATPARVQTFIRNVDRELTKNPLFHALEGLADRHGFEIYIEKESADSLFRIVGTDWLQSSHTRPDLDFLGANQNIQLVVRGSEYHLEIVRTMVSKYLERINPFTKKSRWETRLESADERLLQAKYEWMIPKAYIACHKCYERVDSRFVDFFLDAETDERATQKALDLFLVLRKLDRAVQKRPTRIEGQLFHEAVTMISQMNVFRIADQELAEIFEVMSSIEAASRKPPKEDNKVLITELERMGFFARYQELSKRILARPQYRYSYDFSQTPDHIEQQAGAVTRYVQWTLKRSCEAMFESTGP